MDGLFAYRAFANFGPTRFDPTTESPALVRIRAVRASGLRNCVRAECARRPGVYGMLDARGTLLYVGKAKSLRARLLSYFRPASRDAKAGRIVAQTRAIVWEYVPNEFGALLRELELIRRWRPRFNVQGQPRRRRTYVCLGRRPAPYVYLASRPPAGALACYGPVPGGAAAREAVRRVNDWFQLRDCPQAQEMVFADQAELFPIVRAAGCLRHELGTCLGPCAAACARPDYSARVHEARSFLEGKHDLPLQTLAREMTAASTALAFERAGALRDRLESLRWLYDHLERLRSACARHSFIYTVPGYNQVDLWYLIQDCRVRDVVPVPRDRPSGTAATERIEAIFHREDPWSASLRIEEIDVVLLVASWFRRHPEERERTLSAPEALAKCREAGGSWHARS